jgi:hypothetical protein
MKPEHDDAPAKALALLQRTAPGEDRAVTESSLPPVSGDIGELFLAELQARRERFKHWMRLVSEEARLNGGCAPVVRGSRPKCRALQLSPRAERRLGARRHSTAA